MYGIISGHSTAKVIFKWVPWCLSAKRVLVTSLSIPAGVIYVAIKWCIVSYGPLWWGCVGYYLWLTVGELRLLDCLVIP